MFARIDGASFRQVVCLWLEIACALVLMWLANPTGCYSFQPHVHLYLADRYGRLAVAYGRRSKFATAARLADKSTLHFNLGGGDEPPPAAALAIGSAQQQVLVEAEGFVDTPPSERNRLRLVPKKGPGMPDQMAGDV